MKRLLGFYPGNITLYKLAFKHKSAVAGKENDSYTNNERLEYLGDAILDAVIAHYLFRKFPYKNEGFLTEMRSKIVSRAHLNKLAIKLGLDKFVKADINTGSKSIYGDVFEAFIGAVFIDKGYAHVERFILNRIIKFHIDIEKLEASETNFKGKIIDWAQKRRKKIEFKVINETGRGRNKKYIIQVLINNEYFGKGMFFSKKAAEQRAAEETCNILEIDKNQIKDEKKASSY